MKKIFFAVVAVVAMTACAKEDIVREAPRQAIGFGELFVDNATRADYSDTTVLVDRFKVYGTVTSKTTPANTINLFNGADVTRGTAAYGDVWACSQTEYWLPNCDYAFQAVVDGEINNGTIAYTRGQNKGTDTVSDLLYATANVSTNEDAVPSGNLGTEQTYNGAKVRPVAFTFTHLLSKVKFTVNSTATGNYKHSVTNIVMTGYNSGTYTISHNDNGELNGTWAGNLDDGKLSPIDFDDITNVTSSASMSCTDELLIPISDSFNVSFTVTTYNGNTEMGTEYFGTEKAPITITQDLVAANAYNFIISCEVGAPITFTFESVDDWGTEQNITVQ